jgi:hypothetical protein
LNKIADQKMAPAFFPLRGTQNFGGWAFVSYFQPDAETGLHRTRTGSAEPKRPPISRLRAGGGAQFPDQRRGKQKGASRGEPPESCFVITDIPGKAFSSQRANPSSGEPGDCASQLLRHIPEVSLGHQRLTNVSPNSTEVQGRGIIFILDLVPFAIISLRS